MADQKNKEGRKIMTLKDVHKRLIIIHERAQKRVSDFDDWTIEEDWILLDEIFKLRNDVFDASITARDAGGDG